MPDVEVPAAEALAAAHVLALEGLLEEESGAMPHQRAEQKWALVGKRAELERVTLPVEKLEEYAGTFGERRVWVEDGELRYRLEGRDVERLIPMIPDWFEFDTKELYYVRVRFERNEAGAVRALVVCYDNGREDAFGRTDPA
jgi:hypothetical protein